MIKKGVISLLVGGVLVSTIGVSQASSIHKRSLGLHEGNDRYNMSYQNHSSRGWSGSRKSITRGNLVKDEIYPGVWIRKEFIEVDSENVMRRKPSYEIINRTTKSEGSNSGSFSENRNGRSSSGGFVRKNKKSDSGSDNNKRQIDRNISFGSGNKRSSSNPNIKVRKPETIDSLIK